MLLNIIYVGILLTFCIIVYVIYEELYVFVTILWYILYFSVTFSIIWLQKQKEQSRIETHRISPKNICKLFVDYRSNDVLIMKMTNFVDMRKYVFWHAKSIWHSFQQFETNIELSLELKNDYLLHAFVHLLSIVLYSFLLLETDLCVVLPAFHYQH